MSVLYVALIVAHLGLLAVWLGAMLYSLLIVAPRAARYFGPDDDALEEFTVALGAGNRRPVLAIIRSRGVRSRFVAVVAAPSLRLVGTAFTLAAVAIASSWLSRAAVRSGRRRVGSEDEGRVDAVSERFRVIPAAYVAFRRSDDGGQQVLLQLRQGTGYMDGYWAMAAAGHVEQGESIFEAACREAAEELGITVDVGDLTPLCAMHRTGGNGLAIDERIDVFVECWRWQGVPRVVEPHKTADLRWFALDDLPTPVVPHERTVLDLVRKGDVPSVVTFGFDR